MRLSLPSILLCGLALLLGAGCAGTPPAQTGLMDELNIDATRRQLQILMYAYGNYASGQVELAANRIYTETDSPEVRQNAILWKLNATPEILKSGFANDPSAGMLGSWLFVLQMRDYFETGNGRDVFGDHQRIAIDTVNDLDQRIQTIAEIAAGDTLNFGTGRARMERWAAEYPIQNQLFVRENFSPRIVEVLGGDVQGGLDAAGAMHQQMLALTDRANIMTSMMPRQVQWQSELLMAQGETMVRTQLDSAFSSLQPFLEFLSSERREFTQDISIERTAILTGIAAERLAVLEALAGERSQVLEAIARERNITLEEINKLTLAAVTEVVEKSQNIADSSIDRAYQRTLQLMALPFIVSVILSVAALLLLRSAIRRSGSPPRDA